MQRMIFSGLAIALALAPAAYGAKHGAVRYSTKTPAPIDAGSDLPNPVYVGGHVYYSTKPLPPIDTGSDLPNPLYVPKVRGVAAPPATVVPPTKAFSWGDAAIGAGFAAAVLLGVAAVLAVRGRDSLVRVFR